MTKLHLLAELNTPRFAEIGRWVGEFARDDGAFKALCGTFDSLYWPGRAVYEGHRLRYRLSLYSGNLRERIAVFDAARFPINDVAFHPSRPLLAIATGAYDGGYTFEGVAWLWNWQSGQSLSLLGESREVVRCRFVDDDTLALLLRPRDEGDFDDEAWRMYYGLTLEGVSDIASMSVPPSNGIDPRLADLTPIAPQVLGFDEPASPSAEQHLGSLGSEAEYEEHSRVWDLLWLSDDDLAAVHDTCHLEVWDTSGQRKAYYVGEGFGVQLLPTANGLLVHVMRRGNYFEGTKDRSTLYRLSREGLSEARAFDRAFTFSTDRAGHLLCRDTGDLMRKRERRDLVLTDDLTELYAGDLGHYNVFNHYVRLDDGDGLYFLRGTPAASHERKGLYRFRPETSSGAMVGAVETVVGWDDQNDHLMSSTACWAPDNTLIRAFYVHHPHPSKGAKQLQRLDLATGQPLWTRPLSALVTSLVMVGTAILIYALTDGRIGLVDIGSGATLYEDELSVEGIPTVATALAVRGSRLAVGTIDARILLFEVG